MANIAMTGHLACLKEIFICNCHLITNHAVIAIASHCTLLQWADLGGCHRIGDGGVEALSRCRWLEKLDLSDCDRITDHSLFALSKCHYLRELDVSYCYEITHRGVVSVSKNCPSLSFLRAYGCDALDEWVVLEAQNHKNLKIMWSEY